MPTAGDNPFELNPFIELVMQSNVNKAKAVNRDELQQKFIEWDLNQMSLEDLKEFFITTQNAELDCLDDDELIEEVRNYAPDLV